MCVSATDQAQCVFTTFPVLTHISQKTLDGCLTFMTDRRGGIGETVGDQVNLSFTFAPPSDCEEAQDRCKAAGAGGGGGSG